MRYRFRGRFISAGKYRQLSNLKNLRPHLSVDRPREAEIEEQRAAARARFADEERERMRAAAVEIHEHPPWRSFDEEREIYDDFVDSLHFHDEDDFEEMLQLVEGDFDEGVYDFEMEYVAFDPGEGEWGS